MADRIYAVRDENTGKLVSNITNPRRKYWDRKGNAEQAVAKAMRYGFESRKLAVVTFELVEVDTVRSLLETSDKQQAEIERLNHIRAELSKEIEELKDEIERMNQEELDRFERERELSESDC